MKKVISILLGMVLLFEMSYSSDICASVLYVVKNTILH